jgi:hypothetical protein
VTRKEIVKHQKGTEIIPNMCWNRSVVTEASITPEIGIRICTKFCCDHFTEDDIPFRDDIKKYNLQKRLAFKLYSSLPRSLLGELFIDSFIVFE